MIPSRHSDDPAKQPHLRGSNIPLVIHIHRPAFAFEPVWVWPRILSLWAWGESSGRIMLRPIVSSLTMQPAREGPRLCMSMVSSLSITDPRYLKWSTSLSYSQFSSICNRVSLVDRCSGFATLIFRAFCVKTFCHDASLFWMNQNEYIA